MSLKRLMRSSSITYQKYRYFASKPWSKSLPISTSTAGGLNASRTHSTEVKQPKKMIDLSQYPPERIRNFGIIAHVDHGKSTLSDRLLQLTGTIPSDVNVKQYLDKLQVERERGITVKAQSVAMFYRHKNEISAPGMASSSSAEISASGMVSSSSDKISSPESCESTEYMLNLIDTPGHVDFSYEVYRTLPACQGVILLIDANSGVQAQTVAHYNHAILTELPIIPVINKIDMKGACVESVLEQLESLFSVDPNDVIKISAKQGMNCEQVLNGIIERIPCPKGDAQKPFSGLLFDSYHDKYKGVVILTSILNGSLSVGSEVTSIKTGKCYQVKEVGIICPEETPVNQLLAGQVGYFTANIRDPNEAIVGDVFVDTHRVLLGSKNTSNITSGSSKNSSSAGQVVDTSALEGIKSNPSIKKFLDMIPTSKPMVFAGIFPFDTIQTNDLRKALQKISLTDPSVVITPEVSSALGNGFRLGFLGLLHMEVFNQRLEQEFDAPTVITAPSVPYRVKIKGRDNIKSYGSEILLINNPMKLPDINIIEEYFEPYVNATIIAPEAYLSAITVLCMERRGEQIGHASNGEKQAITYIDKSRLLMNYRFPLSEIIVDFHDALKSISSGYASFDYEDAGYQVAELVRLDIYINDEHVEELTQIVHLKRAKYLGGHLCERLKDTLPQQQYSIKIQAMIGKKVIARENIRSLKKDVTAKLYGGDITRRNKLLARQKEGKERMRKIANIVIPRDCFIQILKKE